MKVICISGKAQHGKDTSAKLIKMILEANGYKVLIAHYGDLVKYIFEAEKIARDLGYKLHARMVWNKVTGIPAAFTIRFGHEYLLYMYKGKLLPVDKDERGKIHSVFTEQVKRHSQKPEVSFEIINRLYPDAKKIELYARKERDGFDCWGNEVAGYKGI